MELKDNTIIVVLGASGDLAKKKTVRIRPCPIGRDVTLTSLQFPALFGLVGYATKLAFRFR